LEVTSNQGVFVYEPQPGRDRLRAITIVNDGVNGPVLINTSCARPLEIGDVFGPYTVTNLVKIFQDSRVKASNNLDIKGTFTAAVPLNLDANDVTYTIYDDLGHILTFAIPAGSFRLTDEPELQQYRFDSPRGSSPDIKAKLDLLECRFELMAKELLSNGQFTGPALTVVMQSGPNLAQEVVNVQQKNTFLEHKKRPPLKCCPDE